MSSTNNNGWHVYSGSEAHGGSTYCALAALSLMGALPASAEGDEAEGEGGGDGRSVEDRLQLTEKECRAILRWCMKRLVLVGGACIVLSEWIIRHRKWSGCYVGGEDVFGW